MVAFIGVVVARPSFTQVRLRYQAQPLQQVKGAVDRGDVDMGILGANLGIDLFGADVAIACLHGGQNQHALWG